MKKLLSIAAILGLSLNAGAALATPVNGTGLLTSDVIFGSGNADGSWTGSNQNGVEVALRGKLRYDLAGNPQNIFNYDGDRTYTFDPAASLAPVNRSIFNFEFSINSDSDGSTGFNLDGPLTYVLEFDTDPTAGTSFTAGDPLTALNDNSYGNNGTANGAGTDGTFAALGGSNNVAQNSQNMGFGYLASPQTNGIYTFNLRVLSASAGELASTSIDIIVGDAQAVPAPGILALFGLGLAALGVSRRKQSS